MDDGLGDLGPNAADDAIRAHQPRSRNRLDQMLRHQRIDGWHPGNVDDRDLGARGDDPFKQILHDGLGAHTVEGADQRYRQDLIPELDDRRREFEQFFLLPPDNLLAVLLVDLERVQAKLVDQQRGDPCLARKHLYVVNFLAQQLE